MAEKRMFSKKITESDAFLDMPATTQLLYFHLSMNADDDGFVDKPKSVMRYTGTKDDDLKVLIVKSFIIPFDSGVVVIKHWRISNYLQKDRYKPTTYSEEMKQLKIKANGAYTLGDGDVANREKTRIPLTPARQKRLEAKKESDLPDSFDYKIRHAFLGEICPICLKEMNSFSKKTQPTIQHNVPISKGGKHELSNISVICGECNYSTQDNETGELNNKLVVQKWNEIIGNVSGMDTQYRLDKNRVDEIRLDKDIDVCGQAAPTSPKRFNKPTLEEVTAYCQERKNNVNPQRFIDFYTSKGWKVGREPMKDWKACVRTWEDDKRPSGKTTVSPACAGKYDRKE